MIEKQYDRRRGTIKRLEVPNDIIIVLGILKAWDNVIDKQV